MSTEIDDDYGSKLAIGIIACCVLVMLGFCLFLMYANKPDNNRLGTGQHMGQSAPNNGVTQTANWPGATDQ